MKLARKWSIPKPACSLAWRIACDSHRTYAPLIYPPQTIAVASIYLAALLQVRAPAQSTPSFAAQELIDQTLRAPSAAQWELQLTTSMEDAQGTWRARAEEAPLTLRRRRALYPGPVYLALDVGGPGTGIPRACRGLQRPLGPARVETDVT